MEHIINATNKSEMLLHQNLPRFLALYLHTSQMATITTKARAARIDITTIMIVFFFLPVSKDIQRRNQEIRKANHSSNTRKKKIYCLLFELATNKE